MQVSHCGVPYSGHPYTWYIQKARKRLAILPGAGTHASGEKSVKIVHGPCKGMNEETDGKHPTPSHSLVAL